MFTRLETSRTLHAIGGSQPTYGRLVTAACGYRFVAVGVLERDDRILCRRCSKILAKSDPRGEGAGT